MDGRPSRSISGLQARLENNICLQQEALAGGSRPQDEGQHPNDPSLLLTRLITPTPQSDKIDKRTRPPTSRPGITVRISLP